MLLLQKYIFTTAILNTFHKLYETHNVKIERFTIDDLKKIKTNILPSERIFLYSYAFITGPYMFPLKLINYIDYLYLIKNNEDVKKYGFNKDKKSITDYF